MAENQEKTEAELLEEAMQNLGLEEVVDGDKEKAEETLVEGAPLSDEDIESLIKEDVPEEETQENSENLENSENSNTIEKDEIVDEISDVDDINLNNTSTDEIDEIPDNSVLKDEEFDVQKKQSKIVRILIIVVSILLTFVSIGVLLYFIGFFDPEPAKTEVKTETPKVQKDEYQFKEADIDANRLNKKLNLLTKYEIVENSATEEKKAIEKENLYLEAKKQLEMERQAQIERIKEAERKRLEMTLPPVQKEEDISQTIDKEIEKVIEKEETPEVVAVVEVNNNEVAEEETKAEEKQPVKTNEEQVSSPDAVIVKVEDSQVTAVEPVTPVAVIEPIMEEKTSQFVKVIKIATKSQDIYKSFLDKIYSVSDNVTLCRDYQNNVEIFIGPFDDDLSRDKISKEYASKYNIDAQEYDYTIEEYDKRCNY
ncbi:MAG: hypothetical protein ACNI28_03455 [Arcobacter sp.]|uniref:hypothetical protein n=1 Tax=Arcobacter sp. TaxID=1872629 RepID=UPI003AFFBE2D